MTRTFLDQTIQELKDELLQIERMVSHSTIEAVGALIDRDFSKSAEIYLADQKVNEKRFNVENECLIAIATQQPLATDLRILASILEIVTELERMGDYAKGVAKVNLLTREYTQTIPVINRLEEMAQIAVDMLGKAVKAFIDVDAETARALPERDDEVDVIFNEIYNGLVESMMEDQTRVGLANQLQWAAHHIERMADRVTNICERTIFVATGIMDELEESDDEWVVDLR
ncbi:MAG: phosphate signaling complex protein PhoU [Aliifodinibius sp.]|nr:phosphate signaling complex protein PhoU [Fodinibius sp.]